MSCIRQHQIHPRKPLLKNRRRQFDNGRGLVYRTIRLVKQLITNRARHKAILSHRADRLNIYIYIYIYTNRREGMGWLKLAR